jgi:hypothetical protein
MIIGLIILIAFIFLISYDPKSRALDKYIPNARCREGRFQEVQFAKKGYKCPTDDKTNLGAIVST